MAVAASQLQLVSNATVLHLTKRASDVRTSPPMTDKSMQQASSVTGELSLLVDASLGRLARWLRCLGVDTEYIRAADLPPTDPDDTAPYGRAKVNSHQALVTAAAGGVGLAAVEVAKLLGAGRVIPACSSDAKLALAASKGADAGINYRGLDGRAFRAQLKEVAGAPGVDVVVDMVGGALLEPCVRSLNWNGRAVVIGFAGGSIPKIPANILLVKNVSVHGLFWGAHLVHDPQRMMASANQLIQWWLAGEITPHVGLRVPLAEANDAFAAIVGRESTGKVVLVP